MAVAVVCRPMRVAHSKVIACTRLEGVELQAVIWWLWEVYAEGVLGFACRSAAAGTTVIV